MVPAEDHLEDSTRTTGRRTIHGYTLLSIVNLRLIQWVPIPWGEAGFSDTQPSCDKRQVITVIRKYRHNHE